jgi:3'-5' exoribonuclease
MIKDKHFVTTKEQALLSIQKSVEICVQPAYHALALEPLSIEGFQTAPASSDKHHVFEGGLLVHTGQVVHTCMYTAMALNKISVQNLVIAAIWHDVGKIWDYDRVKQGFLKELRNGPKWDKTLHRELVGHLPRSFALFSEAAMHYGIPDDMEEMIGHLILSHHGRMEWRSPVEPKTAEAWILHSSDMLCSHYIETNQVK